MPKSNPNFVIHMGVRIINLLYSTRLKHFNAKMLDWELFAQLYIGPVF
jgi:hypothetical protein